MVKCYWCGGDYPPEEFGPDGDGGPDIHRGKVPRHNRWGEAVNGGVFPGTDSVEEVLEASSKDLAPGDETEVSSA
jgi:hypothetical protein